MSKALALHQDPVILCERIDAPEHARRALHKPYNEFCPFCPEQSATTLNTVQVIENTPQGIAQVCSL